MILAKVMVGQTLAHIETTIDNIKVGYREQAQEGKH
jgi:hypothetical protein